MRRRASRRDRSLNIALPQFFGEVLRRAPRERHDGVCGILVRVADERRRVGDEQVLHLVRLAVLVQWTGARVVAHADGADLVDDRAAARDWHPAIRRRGLTHRRGLAGGGIGLAGLWSRLPGLRRLAPGALPGLRGGIERRGPTAAAAPASGNLPPHALEDRAEG